MSDRTPLSPRTPQPSQSARRKSFSPSFTSSPGCSSTPNTSNGCGHSTSPAKRVLWSKGSPSQSLKSTSSPGTKQSFHLQESRFRRHSESFAKENDSEKSSTFSKNASSTDPSWSVKTFSSTESNGTFTVELDFPHGGWDEDEDSANESSSGSLEIVESEVECHPSPVNRGRKRKQSEVSEEDNAILSGMGEEIERQLEAKAERNRLTVPNVKNILRSVITNPYVQAMVRRSIKSGDIAVSGDTDIGFEPRITRAKAKLLCDDAAIPDISWAGTPHKSQQSSECQALINEELNDDSEDDEEYQPGEDEHSDNDYSERDGSERDISIEQQSPAFCDTDTESCPATPSPSPKPHITDSATQTNWSEDGVFKVPLLPLETRHEEENIALRTRSKLPLNDTPLEEIEQAFIPPDITPDLYDATCDNEDWQEFLKEFMQPMRSEPEFQNHDDEDDPEYNVLADEEIIDKEELRKDRAVRVSKRELNELMRELMEFTENLSSDDDDKKAETEENKINDAQPGICSSNNILTGNEDMSLFLDAYMSLGSITPMSALKTTPPTRSPSTPTLNTPVPPMSPPCLRAPEAGKSMVDSVLDQNSHESQSRQEPCYTSCSKGKIGSSSKKQSSFLNDNQSSCVTKSMYSNESGKKMNPFNSSGKLECNPNSATSQRKKYTPGKPDYYPDSQISKTSTNMSSTPGKIENYQSSLGGVEDGQLMYFTPGKLDSYLGEFNNSDENSFENFGIIGTNTPVRAAQNNNINTFSPGKQYFSMNSVPHWREETANIPNPVVETHTSAQDWVETDSPNERCETLSVQVDETTPSQNSISIDPHWSEKSVNIQNPSLEIQTSAKDWVETDSQNESCETLSVQVDETAPLENSVPSDPEVSVSLVMSSDPPSPEETDSDALNCSFDAVLSPRGDVIVNGEIVLSSVQRLVLDQQMRQHVQFLTQFFLLSYQHPMHGCHAPPCKQKLEYLNKKAERKEKSAYRPANLTPALDLIKCWENKLSSNEGPEIIQFLQKQVTRAQQLKRRRQKTHIQLPVQLLEFMSKSTAFIYPQLLPHTAFILHTVQRLELLPSEEQLMALGLEEFTQYITHHKPKTTSCVKQAYLYIAEYLVVSRDGRRLWYTHRRIKDGPVKYFIKNKCAPPTSHVVIPFNELNMVPLKYHPSNTLPQMWRDFMYPASQGTSSID